MYKCDQEVSKKKNRGVKPYYICFYLWTRLNVIIHNWGFGASSKEMGYVSAIWSKSNNLVGVCVCVSDINDLNSNIISCISQLYLTHFCMCPVGHNDQGDDAGAVSHYSQQRASSVHSHFCTHPPSA